MDTTTSLEGFIDECGLSKFYSGESDLKVRLYHDLNIYGDIAESCIEILRDRYKVDISEFNFSDYFPPEFSGNSKWQIFMFSMLPFLRTKFVSKQTYLPLTFYMIDKAIKAGKLK